MTFNFAEYGGPAFAGGILFLYWAWWRARGRGK